MKIIKVLGAIIEKDDTILLARKAQGQSVAGKWEFPGGKLETGESEQECLKREIQEEMKVDVEIKEFFAENLHEYKDKQINLKCYKCHLLSDKIILSDHDSIAWVKPKELLSYDLAPADIPIARKLAGK